MAYLDTNALGAVLKQKYSKKKINKLGYPTGALYAMMPKETDFDGETYVLATKFGGPQGRSHSIARAEADISPTQYKRFTLTRARDYGAFGITTEAARAAKGDMGSMIKAVSTEIENALEVITQNICQEMYRNGGAARGRGTSVSTTVLTLDQAADTAQFEYGMTCVSSADDGTTGSLRSGSVQIVGIDRDAGTVTANVAWSTGITSFGGTDYIFQDGDFGSALKGLLAWLPTTAPASGESFFGTDRSVDATRLGGVRITGGGGPIEETLIESMARLSRERSQADACFMNPIDWAQFAKAISGKVSYDRGSRKSFDDPEIGFDTIRTVGPTGSMDIVPDVWCPKGKAFILQMNTWCFKTLGEAPGILDDLDGLVMLRDSGSDSAKGRVGYYGQIGCTAPGWNAVVTL